jgi:RNA polymerase sigma factor (sigma-70 family)
MRENTMSKPRWIEYVEGFFPFSYRGLNPESYEDALQQALTYLVKRGVRDSWLDEVNEDGYSVGKTRIRGMVRSAVLDWRRANGALHLPLDVPRSAWAKFVSEGTHACLSLNGIIRGCDGKIHNLLDVLSAPEKEMRDVEWDTCLLNMMPHLSDREKIVLQWYLKGLPMKEIGSILDVTESRVSQIWKALLAKGQKFGLSGVGRPRKVSIYRKPTKKGKCDGRKGQRATGKAKDRSRGRAKLGADSTQGAQSGNAAK